MHVCVFVFVCKLCVCCVRIVERTLERTVQGSSLGTILIYSEAPLHRTPCEWIHPIGIFLLAHTQYTHQTGCTDWCCCCTVHETVSISTAGVIGKHITTSWCYEYRQFSFCVSPYVPTAAGAAGVTALWKCVNVCFRTISSGEMCELGARAFHSMIKLSFRLYFIFLF